MAVLTPEQQTGLTASYLRDLRARLIMAETALLKSERMKLRKALKNGKWETADNVIRLRLKVLDDIHKRVTGPRFEPWP